MVRMKMATFVLKKKMTDKKRFRPKFEGLTPECNKIIPTLTFFTQVPFYATVSLCTPEQLSRVARFLCPKYQNGGKYTKLPQNIPNDHKICQHFPF
jgi:hypothetical protein